MNNGRRTPIDGVNDSKSSFPPKLRRSRRGNSSSTNNIKNMTKFALRCETREVSISEIKAKS